jgi:hypothetical protein
MPAFSSPRTVRFVVGLSAATLLLCHGVFGSLHLVSGPVVPPTHLEEHAASHQSPGVPEESPTSHHADAEYFAVLLGSFLGGLVLLLVIRNHRPPNGTLPIRRSVSAPPATIFNLPRGPTLPSLQVLRL